MADAVIHADSQGQVRSGHVPIRTHRSPPTDDDAVAAGELHDPRRLSPRRARPFATPEQPRRLPIRAARTSSGSGWMDRSRRGGAELSGEGGGAGICDGGSERGEQHTSGIWRGASEASSSRRREEAAPICFRQQRGRSARRLCLRCMGWGSGGFSVAPPRGGFGWPERRDPGRLVRRRTAWIGSGERTESNRGTIRIRCYEPANGFGWDGGGTAGGSDIAWAPAAWLCLRSGPQVCALMVPGCCGCFLTFFKKNCGCFFCFFFVLFFVLVLFN